MCYQNRTNTLASDMFGGVMRGSVTRSARIGNGGEHSPVTSAQQADLTCYRSLVRAAAHVIVGHLGGYASHSAAGWLPHYPHIGTGRSDGLPHRRLERCNAGKDRAERGRADIACGGVRVWPSRFGGGSAASGVQHGERRAVRRKAAMPVADDGDGRDNRQRSCGHSPLGQSDATIMRARRTVDPHGCLHTGLCSATTGTMTGTNAKLTPSAEAYFVDLGRVRASGGATGERSSYGPLANLLNTVTEGYAADWTIEQLRGPAQRIADRIEALMNDRTPEAETP